MKVINQKLCNRKGDKHKHKHKHIDLEKAKVIFQEILNNHFNKEQYKSKGEIKMILLKLDRFITLIGRYNKDVHFSFNNSLQLINLNFKKEGIYYLKVSYTFTKLNEHIDERYVFIDLTDDYDEESLSKKELFRYILNEILNEL